MSNSLMDTLYGFYQLYNETPEDDPQYALYNQGYHMLLSQLGDLDTQNYFINTYIPEREEEVEEVVEEEESDEEYSDEDALPFYEDIITPPPYDMIPPPPY